MDACSDSPHQAPQRRPRPCATSGYEATSVDDLCRAAGVTKGAFFHHFKSKEELAVAAAAHWSAVTGALFAAAPYHAYEDPLDQLIAYIDFRAALLEGRSLARSHLPARHHGAGNL